MRGNRENNLELIRLLIAVLALTFVICISPAKGQEPPTLLKKPKCDHVTDSRERFDAMRILPPARIKNFDPKNVEVVITGSKGISVETLNMDADTVIDVDVQKDWMTADVWIVYCSIDKHIYVISKLLPKQKRGIK
jgi:hypothetical protein